MTNELLWLLLLLANFAAIMCVYRFFGKPGLLAWMPLAAITANIQVIKTIELFGLTATLGNIVYAGSFLVTDILSENYGQRPARRATFIGFAGLVIFTALMTVALQFEPAPDDFAHAALATIFTVLPRITVASLIAYFVAQLHDVWAYGAWRRRFPARRLIWLRNIASTTVSQLLDSVIFTLVAFLGVFHGRVLLEIVVTTYLLKLIVAVADTPFVYLARFWFDRGAVSEQDSRDTHAAAAPEDGAPTSRAMSGGGRSTPSRGRSSPEGSEAPPSHDPR